MEIVPMLFTNFQGTLQLVSNRASPHVHNTTHDAFSFVFPKLKITSLTNRLFKDRIWAHLRAATRSCNSSKGAIES